MKVKAPDPVIVQTTLMSVPLCGATGVKNSAQKLHTDAVVTFPQSIRRMKR